MKRFTTTTTTTTTTPPPPPPPAKLVPLLWLAMLAGPVQAQLVIPALTGPEACTQGGSSEIGVLETGFLPLLTTTATFNRSGISRENVRTWDGTSKDSYSLSLTVRENGVGSSGKVLMTESLGTVDGSSRISSNSLSLSELKKNTRHVVVIQETGQTKELVRRCFKTRGEFTPAEQNLVLSEGTWQPNLAQHNQTGCYAVASTRQDIRDCYCNGTRNGTHILAGQTAASQAQRAYLNCPDLDS